MEKYSYVCGKVDANVRYVTLPSLLEKRAREIPQKPAIIFRYKNEKHTTVDENEILRRVVNFGELESASKTLAAAFLNIGVRPRDRVLMIGSNCPEYVFVDFACLRISALMIRLPMNFGTLDVLLECLKNHHVSTLVIDNYDLATKIESAFPGLLYKNNAKHGTSLQNVLLLKSSPSAQPWQAVNELLQHDANDDQVLTIQASQCPDDFAVVFPTSGSTGAPKHVVHTHFSLNNGMSAYYQRNYIIEDPACVYLNDRSFSWVGGAPYICIYFGSTMVHVDSTLLSPPNGAYIFCKIAHEENITDAFLLSYMLFDLKQQNETHNLTLPSSITNIGTGGELVPKDLLDFAVQTFGRVSIGYGCTETLMPSQAARKTDDINCTDVLDWLNTSSGYEIKLVDDSKKLVPKHEIGNIEIRCGYTFSCYLDDDATTSRTKTDSGSVATGDRGIMNENGQLKIVGRSKDVISRGGSKVYPTMIEQMIINNPKVMKVAVVGVPDPRLFNEICAFVIPAKNVNITTEELQEYINSQAIKGESSLVMPKYFIYVDEFPKTHNGKLDKPSLIKMACTKLNLQ